MKNAYPSRVTPHPIAPHQYTSHTHHNTQGPKAPKNLTRGPISVLKVSVVVSPKWRLMRKYFLCLKLWSEAWLCNGSKKIHKFDPNMLRGIISRSGCRHSAYGVHRIESCIKAKVNIWWSPSILVLCMTPKFPTFILWTWNRTIFDDFEEPLMPWGCVKSKSCIRPNVNDGGAPPSLVLCTTPKFPTFI